MFYAHFFIRLQAIEVISELYIDDTYVSINARDHKIEL